MDVGIRELKAKLSEFLRRAERGETFRVTERGQPKAQLGPLPGRVRLQQGIDEGWITPAKTRGLEAVRRYPARRTVMDVLSDDRDE